MPEQTVRTVTDPLEGYWNRFVDYVPQLFGAIVVLLVGLIVASIIAGVVKKVLELLENEKRVAEFLGRWNIKVKAAKFISKFAWWLVFLVFLSASVNILDIGVLTESINSLVAFLPALFAAAAVAVLTVVAARVVKELVVGALASFGFKGRRTLGAASYVIVFAFGLTLAAAQLGLDTTILTANITIIVAGIVLAMALAFGLGGKDLAARLLNEAYEHSRTKNEK